METQQSADRFSQAKWFLDRGCSVIPIDHPAATTQSDSSKVGKTPALSSWKVFQKHRASEVDLRMWFSGPEPRNIGVVTGAISNLVIVDCDSPGAIAWADKELPPTPWRGQTSKGEHRGYRHPGEAIRNQVRIDTGNDAIKIDVRGDGGYIVVPSSLHSDGTIYAWIGPAPSIDDLPVFDPSWLTSAATDVSAREKRSSHLPEVIEAGSRNDKLFKEGCRLRRLGLDASEILGALVAINRKRCKPPLDGRELETIANSCASYSPAVDGFPATETGDAEFFAECNADTVRYDHRRGRWLFFDGHIWMPQVDGQIARLALDSIRARQRAAVGERDRLRWAVGGEARKRQTNLLALAQNIKPIADAGDRWDLDPWLLGAANGIIDLRTGSLRPGRAEDLISMRVRAPFDPEAVCPSYDRTVEEIFRNDPDLIAYYDRYVGYSLTGDCREESLAFCWGDGANGKGTLMNTLGWLLGDYADDLPFSAFELQNRAGIPNDIAKIVNKRFITASETGETARLNESRVKALTGRDPITARFLHKEWFTFQPVAKFWLATNHKPEVHDDSEGFWRRLHLIPFTASFVGREDRTLKDRLREELPGILARSVRGCLAWQDQGLNPPGIVKEATQTYRADSMPLARFLNECCQVKVGARATWGDLFKAYKRWSGDSGDARLGRHEFTAALHQRFETDPANTQRVTFLGIGLLDLLRDEM